jgi:tRNA(Ile)-lysidine synthase
MAAIPTPRPNRADPAVDPAQAPLARLRLQPPLAVAFSGGADSTALLLAAHARWPGAVEAIHVNHGLQAAADAFQRHCETFCGRLGIALHVATVQAGHERGESPEDAARRARYAGLAQAAQARGLHAVLLGHHADDQVETLLLALSRGAGLPGLAAMSSGFERHGMRFERPLLGVPGPQLRAWLVRQAASFIDDPSNGEEHFTRNRIRHRVLPAIEQAFPQFRETFGRSARHAAQAQELLAEIARQDLEAMAGGPTIAGLQGLSRARQGNLLRHWLRGVHGQGASAAQLDQLLDQVAACRTRGHRLHLKVGEGYVDRDGPGLKFSLPDGRAN